MSFLYSICCLSFKKISLCLSSQFVWQTGSNPITNLSVLLVSIIILLTFVIKKIDCLTKQESRARTLQSTACLWKRSDILSYRQPHNLGRRWSLMESCGLPGMLCGSCCTMEWNGKLLLVTIS